jgi:hypothetical protein
MRRFYFHVKRGRVTILDNEGSELADTAQAEAEATRRAREIVTRTTRADTGTIVVADDWQTLFELAF